MSTQAALDKLKLWRRNPIAYVQENFKVTPDFWQEQALMAFADGNMARVRISLQACVGPGKSAVLAWIGWYFLSCWGTPDEHPKGACVSVSKENLRDNLWAEFTKWQSRSDFLKSQFTVTLSKIFLNAAPETWFLSARSFSKSANEEELGKTLSGLHSQFVLCLVDESGSIPPAVLRAAEQALSNCTFGRIVQAGNPISRSGMLFAAHLDEKWMKIKITGDPLDKNRSPRIDVEWAKGFIEKYGRDDPWVMAHVLGEFPDQDINQLIGEQEVRDAMSRWADPEIYVMSQKRIGVDVARQGMDDSIFFPRQGLQAFDFREFRNYRNDELAHMLIKAKLEWGSEFEFIDGTGGFGSGVVDSMIAKGYSPLEIQFSGKALDDRRYANKRAEMWFMCRDWIRRGGCLQKNDQLLKELTAPTYTIVKDKFMLEPKEQIKKRVGCSPDRADALCLTFAMAEMEASPHSRAGIYSYQHQQAVKAEEWTPSSAYHDETLGRGGVDDYDAFADKNW